MSPQEIALISAILAMLQKFNGWPLGMFFFVVIIGPWMLSLALAYSHRKRFEAVVKMYESNVKLVDGYETLAGDLKDVIVMNAETFSALTEAIKHNQFCPIVREKGGTK
nr:hypothetical protein 15 [bacterium]